MAWLSWENPVSIWWSVLVLAAVVNISFWSWTRIYMFWPHSIQNIKSLWSDHRNIIWFSAFYVFGCAFRSVFPRADVQRICLFDTWFSSVMVGRTVATIAELSFVIQWMIVIRFISETTGSRVGRVAAAWILPLIAVAECFSWYAVIRTHYLGNAIEESLWAVTYSLILVAMIALIPRLTGALKVAAKFSVVGCFLYVLFMVTVDVPMYISRLIEDNRAGKPLFGLLDGLHDLNSRWVVTHSIADWKTEIPWQTLYFTFAVLVSIALCYIPLDSERLKKYLK